MKESLNHRDLHGIGTLSSSRFLLELLGMLTNALDGQGWMDAACCLVLLLS